MTYQPFLIAPFATGLDTDMAPWLLPQDAFREIINGHIRHGVVEKRSGYGRFGDMVYAAPGTDWTITTVTKANPAVVTVNDATNINDGDVVEIRNSTSMTELNGNQYTVTGKAGNSFSLQNVNSTQFANPGNDGSVLVVPQTRIMGILRFLDSTDTHQVVIFNQTRAARYDGTLGAFVPLDTAEIMSGSDTDFVVGANWTSVQSSAANALNRLYFTNGKATTGALDGIRYYDGTADTTTLYNPVITGATRLNGAKLIFSFAQRLLVMNTFEGSNNYPQRLRWCQQQAPDQADAWDDATPGKGGYVDCPTSDHIISAQFLQDQIIVFMTNSVWAVIRTADPALPFRWQKINDFRACSSKVASAGYDRYVMAAGIRGLTITDGVETRRIDDRIENFVSEDVNQGAHDKLFALRNYEEKRSWLLYASDESEDSDRALIMDEESSAYSRYDLDFNVLGYGNVTQDKALNDFTNQILRLRGEETLQSYFFDDGVELFLGGDFQGNIWTIEDGVGDNSTQLTATISNIAVAAGVVTVTMSADIGLQNGDIVSISDVVGMIEVNDRDFKVSGKSGNSFVLDGIDGSTFTAYTSGGTVQSAHYDSISFELVSAAWNPWMQEGKQSQLGYIDLFIETDPVSELSVEFYVNNEFTPYATRRINMLPNMRELASISDITNANPGNVSAGQHGLSTGDTAFIYNVRGMNGINGEEITVTKVDDDNFTIGIDTTNFLVYDGGGLVTRNDFSRTKQWKRVYAGGTGYQHWIKITSEGVAASVRIHAFMPWFRPRSVRPI